MMKDDLGSAECFRKIVEATRDDTNEMPLTDKMLEWGRDGTLHAPVIKEDKDEKPDVLVMPLHKGDKRELPVGSLSVPLHRSGKDEFPTDRIPIPVDRDVINEPPIDRPRFPVQDGNGLECDGCGRE